MEEVIVESRQKTWKASEFSSRIEGSRTLAVTSKVAELRRQGVEVISLGAGEPDFPTPKPVCDAAIAAIRAGHTRYTPNAGIFELREAIADYLNTLGGDYSPEEILVSNGAKHSIVNALLAAVDEGDEVLLPAPYWTSYPEQIKMTGASSVLLPTTPEQQYKISAAMIEAACTPKTKLLILNSPSNPTGMVYNRDELDAICAVCIERDLLILADEIYLQLIYDDLESISLASFSQIRDRLLLVNGLSKSHAMTGWRVGYLAARSPFIEAAKKIQSHTTSNACSVSQYAALAALKMAPAELAPMKREFRRRRDVAAERMAAMPGVKLVKPQGAFYLFPDVSAFFGRRAGDRIIRNAMDLTDYLLEEARVAVVPGEAFGAPNNIRISYATSMEMLNEALDRMAAALEKLN